LALAACCLLLAACCLLPALARAKLVRGAYLVSERERAARYGYPDPTHPNIDATHACYQRCSDLVLGRMKKHEPEAGTKGCEFMVASHNQASVEYVLERMEALGIAPSGPNSGVYFGQLLGMSDHLTFLLGAKGYRAYKYVPYGPVEEVVPYLLRRAQENAAMLGKGAPLELSMLRQELARRMNPFAK
jgi:proline dehydrogenase